jgi:hypothetical protein
MIIEFETPFEDFGGINAFDTDGATHEDMVRFCAVLALAVDRMKRERGDGVGLESADSRKLAEAVIRVVSAADWGRAVDALTVAIAGILASVNQLSPNDIDRLVKKAARQIAELAHDFRKGGVRH